MATPAHCLYCFEVLAAHLEDHDALSLSQVEQLWSEYVAHHSNLESNDNDNDNEADIDMDDEPSSNSTNNTKHSLLAAPSSTPPSSSSSSTPSTRPESSLSQSSSRTSLSTAPSQSTLAARLHPRRTEPDKFPAFITWNTLHRNGAKSLRGCIGTFDPQPIDEVLRTYALTAALDDTRFPPIPASELPALECGVTLLTDFEPVADPLDWELGKHGLRINFTYNGKRLGSTYLPDVPREQGWTKNETMVSLMRKAGWSGRRDEWMEVGDLRVTRYRGSKEGVSFDEWKGWRAWVAGRRK